MDRYLGQVGRPLAGRSRIQFKDRKEIMPEASTNFAADSMSMSGSCEQLTDGKWWPFRRAKATKVKAITKNE